MKARYQYGDISGYQPKRLTPKLLAGWRTGLSAANPAGCVLMIREIDRLRNRVAELESALAELGSIDVSH